MGFVQHSSVTLDERSGTSCAVASWHGRLCVAWTGTDLRLNTMWLAEGRSGKRTLRHKSYTSGNTGTGQSSTTVVPLAPALAATGRGVHLAWTGTDRRLNVMTLGHGHAVVSQRSFLAPALGADGREAALAWTGTDRHLNLSHGPAFDAAARLPATTFHAPAICAHEDGLALAWTGTDRRLNLQAADKSVVLSESSNAGPAVCALDDELVLAWTGTDRRINLASARDRYRAPTTLGAASNQAPALCSHGDGVVLVWTGTDRRLNVATLGRRT